MGAESRLLMEDRVIAVQPALVRALGVVKAIVLQQVHWHLRTGDSVKYEGAEWAALTYTVLADETGLTARQIREAVTALEAQGILLSCQPEAYNRRKWYRVDRTHDAICPSDEIGASKRQIRDLPSAKSGASSLSLELRDTHDADASPPSTSPSPAKKPRARTPRDDLFDALVQAFGPSTTPSRARFYGRAVSELLAAAATPEQVAEARQEMGRRGWADPSPEALVKHWDALLASVEAAAAPLPEGWDNKAPKAAPGDAQW